MIYLGENSSDFPALLKNNYGEVQAEGRASVTREDYSITFTSDFVPLYPVGTPMQVVRMHQGCPIHKFYGTVYLSDKKLMRLVSVEDELLPGSEEVYCSHTSFPVTLTLNRSSLPWYRRLLPIRMPSYRAKITAFNRQQAELQLSPLPALDMNFEYILESSAPFPLPKITIGLEKGMLFGAKASYLCNYIDLSQEDEELLHRFMLAYTEEHARL